MTRILGLCGRAGAGKDVVAMVLRESHGFHRIAFADALRAAVSGATGFAASDLEDPEFKKTFRTGFGPENDMTPRKLLQLFGTEVGRAIDPDFWVKCWHRRVDISPHPRIVTTDVRFHNEVAAIRARGGQLVRVRRASAEALPITHESEKYALEFDVDREVHNEDTLEDFQARMRALPRVLWGAL